jgi:hypothetical protein
MRSHIEDKDALIETSNLLSQYYLMALYESIDCNPKLFTSYPTSFRLSSLAHTISSQFLAQANIKSITLSTSISKLFPPHIYADKGHISIIIAEIYRLLIKNFSYGSIYMYIWIDNGSDIQCKDGFYELDSSSEEIQFTNEDELSPDEHITLPKHFHASLISKDDSKIRTHIKSIFSNGEVMGPRSERKFSHFSSNRKDNKKPKGEKDSGTLKIKIDALGMNISDYIHLHGEQSLKKEIQISTNIIIQSNGTIDIDYNPSRINIAIPISYCKSLKSCCCFTPISPHKEVNTTILTLETNLFKGHEIELNFKAIGYKASIATNIGSALEVLLNNDLECKPIIVYFEIPTKDIHKLQLIQSFRDIRPNTPIIVSTSYFIIRFSR